MSVARVFIEPDIHVGKLNFSDVIISDMIFVSTMERANFFVTRDHPGPEVAQFIEFLGRNWNDGVLFCKNETFRNIDKFINVRRAFDLAAMHNETGVVTRMLTMHKVDILLGDGTTRRPYFYVSNSRYDVAEVLLAFGGPFPKNETSDNNAWIARHDGWTCMRYACVRNLVPRALELLMEGCQPECPPDMSHEMRDLMTFAAAQWSHKNHPLYPDVARARVRLRCIEVGGLGSRWRYGATW